jgi:hypothetical protein
MMNHNLIRIFPLFAILTLLMNGCSGPAQPAPTAVPIATATPTSTPLLPTNTPIPPTETPLPTDTPTPAATATSTPTATLTPPVLPPEYAAILETERYQMPGGGFSFQAPAGYSVETGLYQASLTSPDSTTEISLWGSPNIDQMTVAELEKTRTSEQALQQEDQDTSLEMKNTNLGGEPALQLDLGTMGLITSTTVMAFPLDSENTFTAMVVHLLMGDLFGPAGGQEGEGTFDHHQALAAVLASLQFYAVPQSAQLPDFDLAACAYAEDKTYGLSEANPILLYHYPDYEPERIDAYLALMAGPNGETVERAPNEVGAQAGFKVSFGESGMKPVKPILVTYQGLAEPITLYIQPLLPGLEDEITQPPIPIGFNCKEP